MVIKLFQQPVLELVRIVHGQACHQIESAHRLLHHHSGNGPELPDHRIPTKLVLGLTGTEEGRIHLVQLRRAHLIYGGHGQPALAEFQQCRLKFLVPGDHAAHPGAAGGEPLGHGVHDHQILVDIPEPSHGGHAEFVVVAELPVDLVADEEQIVFLGNVRNHPHFRLVQHHAGGVARVRNEDRPGVGGNETFDPLPIGVAVALPGIGGQGPDDAAGGVIRALPTNPWEGYRYADRERIESLITPNTRAILITNPGNPTGVVLDEAEMRMIADIAKKHNLFLICDEVYREFCYDDKFGVPTMARFRDIDENLVIVDSVSKRFSACGARVGCVVTRNKELQAALLKFCQCRLSVATVDQVGAAELYKVDPAFFRASKAEYKLRRDTVIRKLRAIPGVVVEEPMGAFYLMASLPVDNSDKFQHWLLEKFDDHGDTVMFAPGAPFYETPGKGINEVRIAYVLKQEDLERAMDVLAKGIALYQKTVMKVKAVPVAD